MNIVQLQEQLKNFSQDQLIREMQMPSGNTPQFLVLGEIMRRQKMQQDLSAQQAKGQPQTTVAEEAIAAAGVPQGGVASMAQALAPQANMAESTGVQAMAYGGPVKKMAEGDKIVRGGKVLIEQEDGTYRDEQGRVVRSVEEDILSGLATLRDIPSRLGVAARDFSGSFADEMNRDLAATGDEAMRRQMADRIDANALTGRAGFPTGMPTPQQLAMEAAQPRLPPAPLPVFGPDFEYGGRNDRIDPRLLVMAAAQPNLPPAPLPVFGPDFEYGGRGPAVDLDLTAPEPEQPMNAYDAMMERAWRSTAPGAGLGGPNVIPQAQRVEPSVSAPAPVPEVPEDAGDPMLNFQENFDVGLDQGPSPGIGERIFGAPALERAGFDTSRTEAARREREERDKGPAFERGGRSAQPPAPSADAPRTLEEQIARNEAAATTPPGGGGGGVGGGGAGGGGAGGMSSFEQELMDMLDRREKAAEQDKWLALAQVGLNMMSSTQPTLLGAIGEAGVKGVEAARSARDQYDKDRLDLLGALEQSRMARAAAAAKGAGAARAKPINATILGQYANQLESAKSELNMLRPPSEPSFWTGAIDDPDAARRMELENKIAALEAAIGYAYATHGAPYIGDAGSGLDADLSD